MAEAPTYCDESLPWDRASEPLRRRPMKDKKIASWSFDLSGKDVHVWTLRTEASSAVVARFELVLAPDEKDRAARFRFDHLRRSFVLARGALRMLLGCYLDVSSASIQFKYGSKGKPTLVAPAYVDFNVSHSRGLAVFAFTAGREIGVDVEQIRPLEDMQIIADRYFYSEEAAEIMSLTADQRQRAFFHCWTRKEAYIKAIGDGLSTPLNGFRVTLHPSQPARLIHLAHDASFAEAWTLRDLRLAANYTAAIAYRDAERRVAVLPIIDPAELLSIPKRLKRSRDGRRLRVHTLRH
jgi:4'-phosphopantetheinyl transferase